MLVSELTPEAIATLDRMADAEARLMWDPMERIVLEAYARGGLDEVIRVTNDAREAWKQRASDG